MTKKIVMISTTAPSDSETEIGDAVYALADDGKIYFGEWQKKGFVWDKEPLPPLPGDDK